MVRKPSINPAKSTKIDMMINTFATMFVGIPPTFSVHDLNAHFISSRYVRETLKLLPQKPDPILLVLTFSVVANGSPHVCRNCECIPSQLCVSATLRHCVRSDKRERRDDARAQRLETTESIRISNFNSRDGLQDNENRQY